MPDLCAPTNIFKAQIFPPQCCSVVKSLHKTTRVINIRQLISTMEQTFSSVLYPYQLNFTESQSTRWEGELKVHLFQPFLAKTQFSQDDPASCPAKSLVSNVGASTTSPGSLLQQLMAPIVKNFLLFVHIFIFYRGNCVYSIPFQPFKFQCYFLSLLLVFPAMTLEPLYSKLSAPPSRPCILEVKHIRF